MPGGRGFGGEEMGRNMRGHFGVWRERIGAGKRKPRELNAEAWIELRRNSGGG